MGNQRRSENDFVSLSTRTPIERERERLLLLSTLKIYRVSCACCPIKREMIPSMLEYSVRDKA